VFLSFPSVRPSDEGSEEKKEEGRNQTQSTQRGQRAQRRHRASAVLCALCFLCDLRVFFVFSYELPGDDALQIEREPPNLGYRSMPIPANRCAVMECETSTKRISFFASLND
jgi:hypothetical protein